MNGAVSGWLHTIKLIMESRTFSCVACPEGLGVGVGLIEFVGIGVAVGDCVGVVVEGEVGVGETVGTGEGVRLGKAFGEAGYVAT
jgi:hypothetical protein